LLISTRERQAVLTYSFEELQKLFLQDRRYILNCTERTMGLYDQIFLKWEKYAGGMPDENKLKQFIIGQREAGMSPVTVNIAIRGFNAFLNWCATAEYLPKMRMQKLKVEKKVMRVFSDQQLQKLLSFKPKDKYEYRIKAIISTLIDTGLRIQECLSIELANVNFDNLLITVSGKGQKQRVPAAKRRDKTYSFPAFGKMA
jgi:integrase/recombinase XerD